MRQEAEPATSEVDEVAPGILRMQLPLRMPGLGHVNCYAMEDERGWAIVDPGMPGRASWAELLGRFDIAGFKLRHVHTAVVTHSHIDHFGAAEIHFQLAVLHENPRPDDFAGLRHALQRTAAHVNAAAAIVGETQVYLHNVIDPAAERARLEKQRQEIEQAKKAVEGKLSNENFVTRAKPQVVAQAREKLTQLQEQLQAVEKHLAELGG